MVKQEQQHNHSQTTANLSGKKIFWVTVLNAIITLAEIIGGLLSGSLALLSDAIHNLSDTMAIALSYFANRIAQKPSDQKRTYGYKRAEILSAFVNTSILLALSIVLIVEAAKRWQSPEMIDGFLMIVVATIGLIANFISVFILEHDSHENLNIKSSYLHLISDTVSSVGVLIGGIAIQLWGVIWIDPLITMLISVYIIKETWQVIRKTVDILMQSAAPLDYDTIKTDIESIDKVKNIHHVHSWMVNEKTIYFEAHIDLEDMNLSEAEIIYDKIENYLKEYHNIFHVTLQAEVNKCHDKRMFKV
ncbi:cation diffusion facilitator family transporter [Acetobacterium woodii]|uniref:Cation diffusion facilitator transporter n=1 Tax=Acetobacterium woodii (strain ATCC 29683 / DSM 1030 / JCM 2381 / KCTC 1655 / WB1) TaxID=931626 RepID=H6LC72_ACEWD|nr:cation diffusion facilitator family transporter [Acetobacterium woodii]AFA49020.1 cation diffusion facilitator transporter [Acetobacterium woodii DSM 1030]